MGAADVQQRADRSDDPDDAPVCPAAEQREGGGQLDDPRTIVIQPQV